MTCSYRLLTPPIREATTIPQRVVMLKRNAYNRAYQVAIARGRPPAFAKRFGRVCARWWGQDRI